LSSSTVLTLPSPLFFRGLSCITPASYYIQILRGIVIRGATFADLWPQALVLTLMGCAAILLAARDFVRQNTA
jgi:ABC-2 type transport system permease protein